jgi:branched-chain amino acid aminotransferase
MTQSPAGPTYLWRNGGIVPWADATVHVNAVGHASVSAVFEGLRAYVAVDGSLQLFRADEHMRRLHESLRIVRLPCSYSVADLVAASVELLRANESKVDTYVRPWVFVRGFVKEMASRAPVRETEAVIDTWPSPSALLTERGCRAGITSWRRIDDGSMPPRVKAFSNYHNSRLAKLEAAAHGYDEPIFLNDRGKVAEGPGACVALVRRGRLITPEVTSGLLESLTRDTVLRLARDVLRIDVEEREVDRTELYLAEELFFAGTGWEIMPILEIDGLRVGDAVIGPVTRAIERLYHDVARGVDGRFPEWRTAVVSRAQAATPAATRG